MQGMKLAKQYYESYGKEMIRRYFAKYESRIAVGLVGEGSECFGFDDLVSEDHDFGPGFCLWLTKEDKKEIGDELQKAYDALPKHFEGYDARRDHPLSGHRIGVWEIGEFYEHFLGTSSIKEGGKEEYTDEEYIRWLMIPERNLAVAVNGEVFRDDLGEFSRIRDSLKRGYPEDVRIKKMAAWASLMSQTGQYNFPRSVNRGETVAAQLALAEFVKAAISMVYLLNHSYAPFYKWMHRGIRELPKLQEVHEEFDRLASDQETPYDKHQVIERLCAIVVSELRRQGLISGTDPFLQVHLGELMSNIKNERLRKMHWMAGVPL